MLLCFCSGERTVRSFVQLIPQLPLQANWIPAPLCYNLPYPSLAIPKSACQFTDRRAMLGVFLRFNTHGGLPLYKVFVLRIKLIGNL